MKGLILEGITGSGKTTLLRALMRFVAEWWRGPVWIATEHITERVLEPLKTVSAGSACRHADSHIEHLERLQHWDLSAPAGQFTETLFILERFHFSLGLHLEGLSANWLKAVEQRLVKFKPLVVCCQLNESEIMERSVLGPSRERGEKWNAYLKTLGHDSDSQCRNFTLEQQRLAKMLSDSVLCKCSVMVNGARLELLASEIWKQAGVFDLRNADSREETVL